MLLGLLYLFGNMSFIVGGSYFYLTWDIVEPVAYFLELGSTIGLMSLFFIGSKESYSNQWLFEYLKSKNL